MVYGWASVTSLINPVYFKLTWLKSSDFLNVNFLRRFFNLRQYSEWPTWCNGFSVEICENLLCGTVNAMQVLRQKQHTGTAGGPGAGRRFDIRRDLRECGSGAAPPPPHIVVINAPERTEQGQGRPGRELYKKPRLCCLAWPVALYISRAFRSTLFINSYILFCRLPLPLRVLLAAIERTHRETSNFLFKTQSLQIEPNLTNRQLCRIHSIFNFQTQSTFFYVRGRKKTMRAKRVKGVVILLHHYYHLFS